VDAPGFHLLSRHHNEPSRAVPGAEEVEILEIIDRHRIGAIRDRSFFS
jgi:inorganic pyrophosphatase/exopolyphosphatase